MLTTFPKYILMYKLEGEPHSVFADTIDDLSYEYRKLRTKAAMYNNLSIQFVDTKRGILPPTHVIPMLLAGTPTPDQEKWFYDNFTLKFVQSFIQEGQLDLEDETITYTENALAEPHKQAKYFFFSHEKTGDIHSRITPHDGDKVRAVEQLMILLYHQPTDFDSVYERLCKYKGFLKFDFDD